MGASEQDLVTCSPRCNYIGARRRNVLLNPESWILNPGDQAFSTWPKSSSTGVERPKIVTDTRSLFLS